MDALPSLPATTRPRVRLAGTPVMVERAIRRCGEEFYRAVNLPVDTRAQQVLRAERLAEVAERRFQDGDGLGWSSSLVRTAGESNEELRVTHAPGGNDAYARATNELVANASEQLSSRA